jgi:hypothetical protein
LLKSALFGQLPSSCSGRLIPNNQIVSFRTNLKVVVQRKTLVNAGISTGDIQSGILTKLFYFCAVPKFTEGITHRRKNNENQFSELSKMLTAMPSLSACQPCSLQVMSVGKRES